MPADQKHMHVLREKAKKLLSEASEKLTLTPGMDLEKCFHELAVYQTEPETQNQELRTSREQLEESRSEYAELYDFAPVGYLTFSKTGIIIKANLTAGGLLGIERSLLLKKSFTAFLNPESQDLFHLYLQKVLRTTTTQSCHLVLKGKDGAVFDAQLVGIAAKVNEQPAINAIMTDITERTRAQRGREKLKFQLHEAHEQKIAADALHEGEEHHRSLFNNMLNGLAYCQMLFDENGPKDFIYLTVNAAFESLTGLRDVTGKKVSEIIPGLRESDPELFDIYGRVALTGTPERFETYVEALGMWFAVSVYSPQKEHFVAVFDVITERKRAEEALKESQTVLRTIMDSTPDYISMKDREGALRHDEFRRS